MRHIKKYNEKLTPLTHSDYEKIAEVTELTEEINKYAILVFAEFLDNESAKFSDIYIKKAEVIGKFEIYIYIDGPEDYGCEISDYIKYADNLYYKKMM